MKIKKLICFMLCVFAVAALTAFAEEKQDAPVINCSLTDGAVQKGSKKTFEVTARDKDGKKVDTSATFNGEKLDPTWDDSEKTSYTLVFTKEGENTICIEAVTDNGAKSTAIYTLIYRRAEKGELIGHAVVSVEAFTIGSGHLIYPTLMPLYEGENAAEQLLKMLYERGFTCYYGGSTDEAFYLAYIADGTAKSERFNGYKRGITPTEPQKLDIAPSIPDMLIPFLEKSMTYFDENDYRNWEGYLGEFAFTNGSGWMYCVNNSFPNVGFADCYLSDGDIMRVQFTLGYGADIGGFATMGTDIPSAGAQPSGGYYAVANKDRLCSALCNALASEAFSAIQDEYGKAIAVMEALDASQDEVDNAAKALLKAIENADLTSKGDESVSKPEVSSEAESVSDESSEAYESSADESAPSSPALPSQASSQDTRENTAADNTAVYVMLAAVAAIFVTAAVIIIHERRKNA